MNLRATINGKQYDILQGATFAEEFNETLDSGSIVISGVEKINDLLPYDDVYIYSFDDPNYEFKGYPFDTNSSQPKNPQPKFYKHLLVDQFTEEVLRLSDELGAGTYKYKIELMSETKKLETIQLPNISITQPIKGTKTSVWEYANRFVNLYSPTYKKKLTENTWSNVKKYTLDSDLQNIFGNTYAPDFVLNAPSLRALLSKLFLVKDIIPYVKDDVIYGMDISKRNGKFNDDKKYVNIITGTRTSDNHCDNLRRNYSDALVQDRTCRSVEYVGFRNSDNALMTISNMRLELGMPIYKIRKVYLCYYKDIKVNYTNAEDKNKRSWGNQDAILLCKQDITKLVKLNTERNLLSQDWEDLQVKNPPKSVDDMAGYKYCTVGYDIGSRFITGWGDIYTYPTFWNDNKFTSIQNIVSKMDYFYPYGIYSQQYVAKQFGVGCEVYPVLDASFWTKLINNTFEKNSNGTVNTFFDTVESPFTNPSLKFKGLFFMVDYEGFYNGAIVHSKKNYRDDITINDNASESLTLVEQDAIFQNEKVNRFGNKALQINARYDTFYDPNDETQELLQPLASVYSSSYEDDVVIYHREYSIYNNCVQCIYYGIKNYVLKNWFTSVYAKYRTWNLMSYNESVKRAENEKEYIYWSDNEVYYEDREGLFSIYSSIDSTVFNDIISCFSSLDESDIIGTYVFSLDKNINYACVGLSNSKFYSSDLNAFVANNSMCFNLKMNDNFSQGVYISKAEPFISNDPKTSVARYIDGTEITKDNWKNQSWDDFFTKPANSDYSGSKQDYYPLVDEMGQTEFMLFYVAHIPRNTLDIWQSTRPKIDENNPAVTKDDLSTIVNSRYNKIFAIPKPINDLPWNAMSQRIGVRKSFYKDNKSFIDMTLQIENLTMSKDIVLSPWVMKLSDLLGDYPKFDKTIEEPKTPINGNAQCIISEFAALDITVTTVTKYNRSPIITFKFTSELIKDVIELEEYKYVSTLNFAVDPNIEKTFPTDLGYLQVMLKSFTCQKIRFKNGKQTLELCGKLSMWYKWGTENDEYALISDIPFIFVLPRMGNKGSLISSIMPDSDQTEENYGKSLNDSIIYYSGLINNNAVWSTAYGDDSGAAIPYGYPAIPGDIAGGYQTDENYTANLYFKEGNFKFRYNDKDISFPTGNHGLSSFIRCELNLGGYIADVALRKSWNGLSIMSLHNIVFNGDIKSQNTSYATYHKNMFLHYDTEKSLDLQTLRDSYKYSEIENSKDFNFKSPILRFFVSQLKNTKTPYIAIPSVYSVLWNNKPYSGVWRDCKKSSADIIKSADGYYYIGSEDLYLADSNDINEMESISAIISTDGKCFNVYSFSEYSERFQLVDATAFTAQKLKALSFWYLDDSQNGYTIKMDSMGYLLDFKYDPKDCYCHFVLGVNITDNFSRKIYLSMLKKKDLRVFDEHHQVIGESKNYLNSNGEIDNTYATGQFFTKKNN